MSSTEPDKATVAERPDTYAVRELEAEHIEGYAVRHPETGKIVSNRSFDNGYCEQPLTLTQEEAQALAATLTAETGDKWGIELAPHPCPNCGRVIWADDLDFCYPRNREFTLWRAGCNEHDFGCGHEIEGTSYEEVMARWNGKAPPAA